MADSPKQGWWWPSNSRKAHYYAAADNKISLCRKWGRFFCDDDVLEDDHHTSADNCPTCMKRRLKLLEKGNQNGG